MKINDIVEGRIWQGVKDVGRGLGGIASGIGVGTAKALDKFAGGKGEVGVYGTDFGAGTDSQRQLNIAKDATALANMLRQYRNATREEIVTDLIKQGQTHQNAQRQADRVIQQRSKQSQQTTQTATTTQQPAQQPAQQTTQTVVPQEQGFVTTVIAPTAGGDRKFWYDGKNWKEYFGSNWPNDLQTSQPVTNDRVIDYIAKQVALKNTSKVPYGTTKQNKRKS